MELIDQYVFPQPFKYFPSSTKSITISNSFFFWLALLESNAVKIEDRKIVNITIMNTYFDTISTQDASFVIDCANLLFSKSTLTNIISYSYMKSRASKINFSYMQIFNCLEDYSLELFSSFAFNYAKFDLKASNFTNLKKLCNFELVGRYPRANISDSNFYNLSYQNTMDFMSIDGSDSTCYCYRNCCFNNFHYKIFQSDLFGCYFKNTNFNLFLDIQNKFIECYYDDSKNINYTGLTKTNVIDKQIVIYKKELKVKSIYLPVDTPYKSNIIEISQNNYYLNNSYFIDISSDSEPCALYISEYQTSLFMNSNVFSHCVYRSFITDAFNGGIIEYQTSEGNLTFIKSCSLYCDTAVSSFASFTSRLNSYAKIEDYTMCYCSNSYYTGNSGNIYQIQSNILRNNISNNIAHDSIIAKNFYNADLYFDHCHYFNNSIQNGNFLEIENSSVTFSNCNFISNFSPLQTNLVKFNYTMEHCYYTDNNNISFISPSIAQQIEFQDAKLCHKPKIISLTIKIILITCTITAFILILAIVLLIHSRIKLNKKEKRIQLEKDLMEDFG